MSQNPFPVQIDIISDMVCPWCYVGKTKLEKALETFGNQVEPTIVWRPFQLNPEIPNEGVGYKEHLVHKFGNERSLDAAWQRLKSMGMEIGLDLRFEDIPKAPNTLAMHTLVRHLDGNPKQNEFVGKLFVAHFTLGRDLTSVDVIWEIASPYFENKESFEKIYSNLEMQEEIRKEIAYYHQNGVSGVPYFIMGNKYALSGAQNSEVFVEVIQTILKEQGSEM
ncbi:DsbA family oxidoreductase [Leptospira sp. 96542]|nr:DsbA family oxidoreductase [Leptospira sp. 96542]